MELEELADELRVALSEGLATHRRSASHSTPHTPHLSPDAFRRKWGRCPAGFNADPETDRCTPVAQLKAAGPKGPHGEPAATVKQVAAGPRATPPSTVKQVKAPAPAPKAAPAKAEPAAASEPKKHGFIKRALKGVWHAISDPFKKAYKLATDKKYRTEVKDFVVKACRKEGTQTKAMAGHIARALKGEKLTAAEKGAVMDQMADIVKVALMSSMVGHVATGGIAKAIATLASPADELIGVAIDKPLRAATKKFFGREHGILPTSFYEESVFRAFLLAEAYKEGDEYKVIEKMVDAIVDEMSKAGLDDDDIAAALAKSGLRGPKKKTLVAKILGIFSKKESVESELVRSMRDLLGEQP
jgi:hypothetical protein